MLLHVRLHAVPLHTVCLLHLVHLHNVKIAAPGDCNWVLVSAGLDWLLAASIGFRRFRLASAGSEWFRLISVGFQQFQVAHFRSRHMPVEASSNRQKPRDASRHQQKPILSYGPLRDIRSSIKFLTYFLHEIFVWKLKFHGFDSRDSRVKKSDRIPNE